MLDIDIEKETDTHTHTHRERERERGGGVENGRRTYWNLELYPTSLSTVFVKFEKL